MYHCTCTYIVSSSHSFWPIPVGRSLKSILLLQYKLYPLVKPYVLWQLASKILVRCRTLWGKPEQERYVHVLNRTGRQAGSMHAHKERCIYMVCIGYDRLDAVLSLVTASGTQKPAYCIYMYM